MRGSVHGVPAGPAIEAPAERKWIRGSGDQSNSVAFLNDRAALKLFRRIEPGHNPELEIGRFLFDRGFPRVPTLAGAIEYNRPSLEPGTLAIVQSAVKHQGSGWDYSVDDLRRYFERVAARGPRPNGVDGRDGQEGREGRNEPSPFFLALENWYLASATTLGRRTGELHLTLADSTDTAFSPEPLDARGLGVLADAMTHQADTVIELLRDRLPSLGDDTRAQAQAVIAAQPDLVARFDDLRKLTTAGSRIRVHGDYHLGQVLRTEEDFVILDFEGEPARSLAERRAKQSPLKDVAGMVRSFSYAAYAALFAFTLHAPDLYPGLEPWADTWQRWASRAFLNGYESAVGRSPIVPADPVRPMLLRAFILEKVLYELGYELNNRPEWVRIPLAGIAKLANRLHR